MSGSKELIYFPHFSYKENEIKENVTCMKKIYKFLHKFKKNRSWVSILNMYSIDVRWLSPHSLKSNLNSLFEKAVCEIFYYSIDFVITIINIIDCNSNFVYSSILKEFESSACWESHPWICVFVKSRSVKRAFEFSTFKTAQ